MKTHELKTVQPYFDEVWSGNKTFECRLNDRDFNEGDIVILKEYDANKNDYSGMEIAGRVGYVLKNYPGLENGYVVFSFEPFAFYKNESL